MQAQHSFHLLQLTKEEEVVSLVDDESEAASELELAHVPPALHEPVVGATVVAAASPVPPQGNVIPHNDWLIALHFAVTAAGATATAAATVAVAARLPFGCGRFFGIASSNPNGVLVTRPGAS